MPAGAPWSAQDKVKHVFVLMMENRSYDHLLGYARLRGRAAGGEAVIQAEGLDGSESNPAAAGPVLVSADAPDSAGFDPKHEFADVREQACGPGGDYPRLRMDGFVASNGPEVMRCFSPERLPVLATLAASYAVCDHWFSALPGPTWPNRLFAHAATSGGLFCSPNPGTEFWKATFGHYAFQSGNVFQALEKAKKTWRIYHQWIPQALTLAGMGAKYLAGGSFRDLSSFERDLEQGDVADYTFIEPHYGGLMDAGYTAGNSQHPNGDIQDGEALIRRIYLGVRGTPAVWKRSLLLVTYDEHGGFYDHVPPPAAVAPGDSPLYAGENASGLSFDFKTLGLRVPAVAVSPWIPPNTVDQAVYDHSSISKTLHGLFATALLTKRDALARGLEGLLTLDSPRLAAADAPVALPPALARAAAAPVAASVAQARPMEGLDQLLLGLGARVKSVLDGGESLDKNGDLGAAVPTAVHRELDAIRTKGQAADYLDAVHRRVLKHRQGKGGSFLG